jgi:hypothetical protein
MRPPFATENQSAQMHGEIVTQVSGYCLQTAHRSWSQQGQSVVASSFGRRTLNRSQAVDDPVVLKKGRYERGLRWQIGNSPIPPYGLPLIRGLSF